MRILLRVDFNVPYDGNKIVNDVRIRKVLPTINFLRESGAKVIILSHVGRDKRESLGIVAKYLSNIFPLKFVNDIFSDKAVSVVNNMDNGEVVLFENLRRYSGEKENSLEFTKHLASFASVYVNEAFSVSHRDHASITGIPKILPSFAGFRFDEEVRELSKSINPSRPALVIIGGAKFDTKLKLVRKFLNNYDKVFLVGALANNIYKYYGLPMESSLVSDMEDEEVKKILETKKIMVPIDVTVLNGEDIKIKNVADISKDDRVVDSGPKTQKKFKKMCNDYKFIIWNGPLGEYEKGFSKWSKKLAKTIAKSKAQTVLGGGDTLAVVADLNLENKFSFISLAGGAMLEFLEQETLVGIDALGS